jgi:peroxiredoxin
MIKYGWILYLVFIISSTLIAQNITISVAGASGEAFIYQLEGENVEKIDSVISPKGNYLFSLEGKHNGFYRLQFDKKHWIDFINDGSDVEIKTELKSISESISVIKSESNELYLQFIKLNKLYKTKTELLNIILTHYPKNDDYYEISKSKLLEVQSEYQKFVNVTSQKKGKSFIARYIKSAQLPIVDISLPPQGQMEYLKSHALDNIDFNDIEMIYSNLYTNKSIEYLTYYGNQQLPKALLEKEFIKAVDTLLNRAKINELVYKHTTEYLIDGFTKFGFDAIINYIVDNYVIKDDICLDTKVESTIQKRIDQAKYFKIGSKVPNIILPNINGGKVDLSKINSEKVLILFYASWCPHCKKNLPELVKLYNNQKKKKIEILAVSIDEKRKEWEKVVADFNMNWLNVSDLKGWNGKTTEDYFIYATPTMFFVDKDKKVEAKPLSINEIRKLFSQ